MGRKLTSKPQPYVYPLEPHVRRHGPFGYQEYESYREWLRDEFSFRCVFCLMRETWTNRRAIWHLDHRTPQAKDPSSKLDYENLLYVCSGCNITKSIHLVPDPCQVALGKCLKVKPDGSITALNEEGELLIEILRLDNSDYRQFRQDVIGSVLSFAQHGDQKMLAFKLRYPEDLPDLSRLKPSGNTKPDGISNSHYARRTRGELPEIY